VVALSLLSSGLLQQALAQDSAPSRPFQDRVEVHWILIPAVVPASAHAGGGDPDDFELFVDGRPVPIATVGTGNEPTALLWLQDLSGSMATLDRLALSRRLFDCLVAARGSTDELLVATFSDRGVEVQLDWTRSRSALEPLSESWEADGETALVDAMTWLPELLLEGRRSRRLALVVTDGRDNASRLSTEDARRRALSIGLPLYVVDLSAVGLAPHLTPSRDELSLWLENLADATGGRRLEPRSEQEMEETCRRIAADLDRQVLVGFVADSSTPPAEHRLQIRADAARMLHRPSYFGPAPSEFAPLQPPTEEN
jgi:hypothetical protein